MMTMTMRLAALLLLLASCATAFVVVSPTTARLNRISLLYEATTSSDIAIDPKELVKLFGRFAEKYIMLDDSGGLCCYSACSDCEFRLPDGGYRMADQSAARPKWIPVYEARNFEALQKEHTSKWSTTIFSEGPAVDKETFVKNVVEMEFAPPLGGPYMSKSAAGIEDEQVVELLFDSLAGDKEKLTKHRMSTQLKEMSGGEQGITWQMFEKIMTE